MHLLRRSISKALQACVEFSRTTNELNVFWTSRRQLSVTVWEAGNCLVFIRVLISHLDWHITRMQYITGFWVLLRSLGIRREILHYLLRWQRTRGIVILTWPRVTSSHKPKTSTDATSRRNLAQFISCPRCRRARSQSACWYSMYCKLCSLGSSRNSNGWVATSASLGPIYR